MGKFFDEPILKKMKKNVHKPKRVDKANDSLPFSKNLSKNEETLKIKFGKSNDIIFHHFLIHIDNGHNVRAMIVGVDGLFNEDAIRNNVLKPLTEEPFAPLKIDLDPIKEKLSVYNVKKENDLIKTVFNILKGQTLVLIDGYSVGLLLNDPGFEVRAISEPQSERVVRGARDGFVETIATNLALLRRRIAHPSLQFESIELGEYSQTEVVISYLDDIADNNLVEKVRQRLKQIKVDGIKNSGEVEQMIETHPFSIFPTIGSTERPDKAAALLLEGRILILINGDPFVLYVPSLFLENLKSIEDYSSRPYYSSFIRLLRIFAFLFSISLPAVYISVVNFLKSMIPSDMIIPLIQARETVPFPLVLEIFLMVIMFEIVREAGVRLPAAIGPALSIVGALILGQVSVSAGLVGAPTIVIVSLSYISAFVITPLADVTALVRMGLIIASSIFGSFGLIIAMLGLLMHMVSLTSMGVPYMAPFAPFHFKDWNDAFLRLPIRWAKNRPESVPNQRPTRIKSLPKAGDE